MIFTPKYLALIVQLRAMAMAYSYEILPSENLLKKKFHIHSDRGGRIVESNFKSFLLSLGMKRRHESGGRGKDGGITVLVVFLGGSP